MSNIILGGCRATTAGRTGGGRTHLNPFSGCSRPEPKPGKRSGLGRLASVRVLVLADTHLRAGSDRDLPAAVWAEARRCDHILHAGDVLTAGLLGRLARFRPARRGARQQRRHPHRPACPRRSRCELDGRPAGDDPRLRRDEGPPRPACAAASPAADIVIYGHSHMPDDSEGADRPAPLQPRQLHGTPVQPLPLLRHPRVERRPHPNPPDRPHPPIAAIAEPLGSEGRSSSRGGLARNHPPGDAGSPRPILGVSTRQARNRSMLACVDGVATGQVSRTPAASVAQLYSVLEPYLPKSERPCRGRSGHTPRGRTAVPHGVADGPTLRCRSRGVRRRSADDLGRRPRLQALLAATVRDSGLRAFPPRLPRSRNAYSALCAEVSKCHVAPSSERRRPRWPPEFLDHDVWPQRDRRRGHRTTWSTRHLHGHRRG